MYIKRKLKPEKPGIDLISALLILPVILIVFFTWGHRAGWAVLAGAEFLVVLLHLNIYLRTKNRSFLWLSFAFLVIVIFAVQVSAFGMTKSDPEFMPSAVAVITAILIMAYIVSNKKIRWRYNELLELSALKVEETADGFTERPLYTGKIDTTREELDSLANFISRNDYMRYQDTYSFDQLCYNLGRLFIDFFELHRKGEGIRIINRLNSLKMNPIIE
jgi:hypothetical protein